MIKNLEIFRFYHIVCCEEVTKIGNTRLRIMLERFWASLVVQLVKNPPAMCETWIYFLGWEDPLQRERLPTPVLWLRELHGLCVQSPWGRKESGILETTWHSPYVIENIR